MNKSISGFMGRGTRLFAGVAGATFGVIALMAAPAFAAGAGVISKGTTTANIEAPAGSGFPICGIVHSSTMDLPATGTWTTAGSVVSSTFHVATDSTNEYYANPVGTYASASGGCGTAPEAVNVHFWVDGGATCGSSSSPLTAQMERVNSTVTITAQSANCSVGTVNILVQGQQEPCGITLVIPDCLVDFTGGSYTVS